MLIPTFRIELGKPVLVGLTAVGRFDGKSPSIAMATSTDNIIVHSPHRRDEAEAHELKHLNMAQTVTAITAGDLKVEGEEHEGRDVLCVGTTTNLIAFDTERNSGVFYNEVPDGVSAAVFGILPSVGVPTVIVGGQCTLFGYDGEGTEQFWTVTGDNVSALALMKYDEERTEILVGTEDQAIRTYQDATVISEVTESDVITGLIQITDSTFGYLLANQSLGVYTEEERLWAAKCKHSATCVTAFDLDADGKLEMIAGWSNGRMEVRKADSGTLVYKDRFPSSLAGLVSEDYRLDGREELIAVAVDGQMRGYLPASPEQVNNLLDQPLEERQLSDLYQKKQELTQELATLASSMGKPTRAGLPKTLRLEAHLDSNPFKGGWELHVFTRPTSAAVIKMVVSLSDELFEGESEVTIPESPTPGITLLLKPKLKINSDGKDSKEKKSSRRRGSAAGGNDTKETTSVRAQKTRLSFKIWVGLPGDDNDHVFERTFEMPILASFSPTKLVHNNAAATAQEASEREEIRRIFDSVSNSHVTFFADHAQPSRVVLWFTRAFNFFDDLNSAGQPQMLTPVNGKIEAHFLHVVDKAPLRICFTPDGMIEIHTEDMELAGDIVQDMCKWLGLGDVSSTANFPKAMEDFKEVIDDVLNCNKERINLSGSVAGNSNQIKMMITRAEEARLLGDMNSMTRTYMQLYTENLAMIRNYNTRANNHAKLLLSLKKVNQMIQIAARFRHGSYKASVVSACRSAIKTNNINSLFNIIKFGHTDAN